MIGLAPHYRGKILKITYKQKSPGKEFTLIQDGMECAPKRLHRRTEVITIFFIFTVSTISH